MIDLCFLDNSAFLFLVKFFTITLFPVLILIFHLNFSIESS